MLTYLRLTRRPLGLLMNFGMGTFKEGIHKVLRDNMEQNAGHNVPAWLEWNPSQLTAKVLAVSTPEDVPFEVNLNLIIEFYR